MDDEKFLRQLEELKELCKKESEDIKKKVQEIVPTYFINNGQ